MGGFQGLVMANDGDHFGNAENPVADAVEAIGLAGGLGFGRRRDQRHCQQRDRDCTRRNSHGIASDREPTQTKHHPYLP